MAALTFIDLTNRVRDRVNEVRLTTGTWSTTIGFDQYSKDAVNYAYHDILNAEMEWPFLHQSATFKTTPGVQFYTPTITVPTGFTSPAELKQIDYESFYISDNETRTTISNETHPVASSSPYIVTPTNAASWQSDLGVTYTASGTALTPVTGDPSTGQYTITDGIYYFASGDAGVSVKINYIKQADATTATVITAKHLSYVDYDFWRQTFFSSDLNAPMENQKAPDFIFKTRNLTEIGLTPVPDKIYNITYEYWLDGLDLSATTDTPLIPTRFNQVIIDGAIAYCYDFREDPQLAKTYRDKFAAGVNRMRIELINRRDDMKSGFLWYPRGKSYAISTPGPR